MVVNVGILSPPDGAHKSVISRKSGHALVEKPDAYSGLIPANLMTLARISASSATSLVKHRERVHKRQRAEPGSSTLSASG
jgi:hypothetical protein